MGISPSYRKRYYLQVSFGVGYIVEPVEVKRCREADSIVQGKSKAMAEITNLNEYRKQRKKEAKRKTGAKIKARKGRTKISRLADKIISERRELELDGKKFIDRARSRDKEPD